MEITSVNNELVKEITKLQQKKYRQLSGKFIIEGYKSIKEAFDFGIKIEQIFVEKCHVSKYNFAQNCLIETNSAVLKKISSTDTSPEAVAVGVQKTYDKTDIKGAKRVVLLENIRDLGNLGTIVRTCVAFGVDAIILFGECADIYSPKVVRSCVGNLWKIPIVNIEKFEELEDLFEKYERIATLPKSQNLLKMFDCKLPCLLMFGSEADGLSFDLVNFSTNSIKIEMGDNVESLNLATSVAICVYEIFVN